MFSSLNLCYVDIATKNLEKEINTLFKNLFPICRSLTGEGVKETFRILHAVADFDIKTIPSGTKCYDWKVPDEWNIKDAFIADEKGGRLIDFAQNNLHVVNYSAPIDRVVSFDELKPHIHTLPDLPNAIPYRTSYYSKNWGFCLAYQQFKKLNTRKKYRVYINASLKPGVLAYGERVLSGKSGKEFLISTYCCHPSLANDNLSGQVLWTLLLRELAKKKMRHSYRFVISPESIGAIAYLSKNEKAMKKISGGFVITTVAGPGKFGYKHTFLKNHPIDRAVDFAFLRREINYIKYPFEITGSDEKHFSAPYFRIPVGTICKDKYYEYDYYHTSLDNLSFIKAKYLLQTLQLYLSAIENLEMNVTYKSLSPYSEPHLGKRGLYPALGGFQKTKGSTKTQQDIANELDAIRWIMFLSDGETSLFDVAHRSGISLSSLHEAAKKLQRHKLLKITNKT